MDVKFVALSFFVCFGLGIAHPAAREIQAAAGQRPIRIYVFAVEKGPDGFTVPDYQAKADSVTDVRPYLMGRKRGVSLVQSATLSKEDADVVVEVLGREASKQDDDLRFVHLKVTAGTHTFTVEGKDDDGGWREAAKNGADQIVRWIAANYDRIVAKHP